MANLKDTAPHGSLHDRGVCRVAVPVARHRLHRSERAPFSHSALPMSIQRPSDRYSPIGVEYPREMAEGNERQRPIQRASGQRKRSQSGLRLPGRKDIHCCCDRSQSARALNCDGVPAQSITTSTVLGYRRSDGEHRRLSRNPHPGRINSPSRGQVRPAVRVVLL